MPVAEPVVVGVLGLLAEVDRLGQRRVVVAGDAAGLARDGLRVAAGRVDPPHLRGPVERRLRLAAAPAVAEEVDGLAVGGPLRLPKYTVFLQVIRTAVLRPGREVGPPPPVAAGRQARGGEGAVGTGRR